ncbi:hypothetical protein [Marinoscillum furvescens]|uniref:hypothetical protein n=1 Tax=Marinoscillum furvescens TaxID=1026 RepID=UPI001C869D13|nr:hypothetical protein [Marinoscillum furvescens]
MKHLVINNERMIGIKFYPDKVIQALIKTLFSLLFLAAGQAMKSLRPGIATAPVKNQGLRAPD